MHTLDSIISEKDLVLRIKWFISLRWWAACGVAVILTFSKFILKLNLPFLSLYIGNIILFAYNLLFLYINSTFKQQDISHKNKKIKLWANIQIFLDLYMLSYFIHFAGGPENPFYFYFIFHMVIASIILSNIAAYLQATLAVILMGVIFSGEYFGIINHYHLDFVIPEAFCFLSVKYFFIIFIVFISTLYTTVYFATSIVNKMRSGEVDLEKANRMLNEKDRIKSKYVETISHDIKASLSAIQSCLNVVLNGLTGPIKTKPREMISRAEYRSRTLLYYVKELWNLSSMRITEEIEKKNIPLLSAIEKSAEQMRNMFEEKKLSITVNNEAGDTVVYANDFLLRELLFNLIQNACKYNTSGGKVAIRMDETRAGGFVRVSVADTGIGISEDCIAKIFDDFYRAKNAEQSDRDGTGLGLAIVKWIIDTHEWEIEVESELDKGSTFTLIIPRGQTEPGT
ncbi:MAG TPA: HAMP domain-containing histidine kinase [Spirochaetes bacterium]|nr:HAMP domain-containing histidine kinase [Spirochaetota bacterium]